MLRKRTRSIQKDQQMGHIISDLDGGSETCLQSDVLGQRQKTNSFFSVPGLFVGLSPKGALDCDSVRSPTSPLDFKLFSNLGTSFRNPNPKPSQEGHLKSWDSNKVGLGTIVDSLDDVDDDDDDDGRNLPEKPKTMLSSKSKTILFGSQIRSKGAPNSSTRANFFEAPKSLPKNYAIFPHTKLRPSNLQKGSSDVLFEIGGDPLESDPFGKIQSFSLDSKSLGSDIYRLSTRKAGLRTGNSCLENGTVEKNPGFSLSDGNPTADNRLTIMQMATGDGISRSLDPREIELSEDYTCVISHGPNPKTTHIFGDCVLEGHPNGIDSGNKRNSSDTIVPCLEKCLQIPAQSPYPMNDFLSYCCFCKKKLEEGKDIYMYRGEKAFCSWDCRLEEISIEEEHDELTTSLAPGKSPESENGDDIFEIKNIFVAM